MEATYAGIPLTGPTPSEHSGPVSVPWDIAVQVEPIIRASAPFMASRGNRSADVDFNERLEASVRGMNPRMLDGLHKRFGDQVMIREGRVAWRGEAIGELVDKAIADPNWKGRVSLGEAWPGAVEAAKEAGEDISGFQFDLSADDVRHVLKRHGTKTEEKRGQRPVRKRDFELLPGVLRDPDTVAVGKEPDTIGFAKDIEGRHVTIWWLRGRKKKRGGLKTMWIKRGDK